MPKKGLPRYARIRAHGSDETGQALVETALVVPVLLVILLGAAEIARIAYAAIEVSNSAKAGAQYGAQNRKAAQDTPGIQNAAANDAADLTGLTTTPSLVCTCSDTTYVPTNCSDNTTCSSHNTYNEVTLTVTTSATYTPVFHTAAFPGSIVLNGKAVQKVLN